MKNTIGADECDAALALIFFHTTPVNISLVNIYNSVYFLQIFVVKLVEKWYPDSRKFDVLRRSNFKHH